ncbi:sigma 54-interacting transcriptional regulator [Dehalobacterium formicoaceticum]|uniref:Sigma 54-interacting transcriptional regulator n=1 Tax=Dehalobacterium formicoaceticum TaxID=51515 RepID=A0ABT1Y0G3_9FIRM|nr:sigma 54-interacting transcriptional regulator [Dehalobacterium formicoaceticum]MCR6544348.1 sigma 54-interacting transcriptional regulator [Dehalobacterium formicoaceticum]
MKRDDIGELELLRQEIEILKKTNIQLQEVGDDLERENQLLKTILDSIHEGVYATDEKGKIILYNREVEKTEGLKRSDVLGKKETDVYSYISENNFYEAVTEKVMKTVKPLIEHHYKYYLPNGKRNDILINAFPFFYQEKLAGVYTVGRDVKTIGEFISNTLVMQRKLTMEENNPANVKGARYLLDHIIGDSKEMKETVALARKVAGHSSPILIVGETGTGKELFAQGIHNASLFAKGPFVPVNCAAIPDSLLESILFGTVKGAFTGAVDIPGLFEQAENGTIFLDEINSMPFSLQAKLLRVLQDKVVRRIGSKTETPINTRIISATNVDPFVAVQEQVIRSDLFFRLATVTIDIPPLRERKNDIHVLGHYFIRKFNDKFGIFVKGISRDLIKPFEHYYWPGNVRELENIIESGMNFVEHQDDELDLEHLPMYFQERLLKTKEISKYMPGIQGTLRSNLQEFEKRLIYDALLRNSWNITRTAQELGILRQNLQHKIKVLNLQKENR